MDFNSVTEFVNTKLKELTLGDRVLLFKTLFNYPIDFKDSKYYYSNNEWDEVRMSDFLKINEHWLNVPEFDRLMVHFKKLEADKVYY